MVCYPDPHAESSRQDWNYGSRTTLNVMPAAIAILKGNSAGGFCFLPSFDGPGCSIPDCQAVVKVGIIRQVATNRSVVAKLRTFHGGPPGPD